MRNNYDNLKVNIIRALITVILIIGITALVGCDFQEIEEYKNLQYSYDEIEDLHEIDESQMPESSGEEELLLEVSGEEEYQISGEDHRDKYNLEMATYTMYATTAVNIRMQRSLNSPKIGKYKDGDSADVITNENGWEVVIFNGQIGFAKGTFFTDVKPVHNEVELVIADRGIDPDKPMVALTFDDGPNPNSTPRILDTLEQNKAVATFFDLGYLVERMPEITKREEAIGCVVGNHSYNHKNFNKLSASSMALDMEKSEAVFEKVLGHKTNLFRPPYGNHNKTLRATLDYPIVRWNIDTLDWKTRNKDKILAKVRSYKDLDGCVILMHSIYGTTADAVEVLVPELIEKGYQLVTIPEIAYYRGYNSLRCGVEYNEFTK